MWCSSSTLAQKEKDMGLTPALGTISSSHPRQYDHGFCYCLKCFLLLCGILSLLVSTLQKGHTTSENYPYVKRVALKSYRFACDMAEYSGECLLGETG